MTIFHDLISVPELQSLIGNGGCRVVDCRFDLFDADKGRRDYLSGHIPGAVHADMDRDLASEISTGTGRHPLPDVEVFRQTLQGWGIGNETQVIAYDYGNAALAARLWWMLRWLGHDRVAVLDGGFAAWTAAGGETETVVADPARARFTGTPDESMIATTAEIETALGKDGGFVLVDARDEARFRGDMEPIDTVAGHIPAALNLPLTRTLHANGTWRDADELSAIWTDCLLDRRNQAVVVMCGSGVTACHLVLSARIAGLEEPRLYVGSWSEWIRDQNRPVATS